MFKCYLFAFFIQELFGAVGALKKAHLLKPGCAEVVYISYNDAVAAVNKYHNRELDGRLTLSPCILCAHISCGLLIFEKTIFYFCCFLLKTLRLQFYECSNSG